MIKQQKTIKSKTLVFSVFLLSFLVSCNFCIAQSKSKKSTKLSEFQINQRKEIFLNAVKERTLGNYNEAEKLYKDVLAIDPEHDASMYELARIYLTKNRSEDAVKLLEKACELSPDNEWYLELLAGVYKETYQIDKLIIAQEQLVKRNPGKIDYKLNLSLIYVINGDIKKAIAVLDEIEEQIGKTEEVSIQKKQLYLISKKPKQATDELESLVNAYPDNTRYLQILAETYLDTDQEDKALTIYKRIKEIDPDNPYIHISMADLYKKQGNDNLAIEELKAGFANTALDVDTKIHVLLSFFSFDEYYNTKKSVVLELVTILAETHPDNNTALAVYGEMLNHNQEHEKALEVFDRIIANDESNYSWWEQKLFLENQLQKSDNVYNTSQRMIELFPMQPLPYLFNGFALLEKKNYEAARHSLENGVMLVIDNDLLEGQFYSTLGDVYNKLKEHEKSDRSYDKALKLKPDDAYVLNNYSYYLTLRMENLPKAKEMAAKANELMPDKASFQDTYGWVLFKMGDYENAEKWLKKAIDNDNKNSPVLLEHYGDVLFKLGRKTDAMKYWIKAKENTKEGETTESLQEKIRTGILHE